MENTNTSTDNRKAPPLWKQLVGASVGGVIALALYYGYEYGKPHLVGYLTLPQTETERTYELGSSHFADKTMDEDNRRRLLSRNVRVANALSANAKIALTTVDTHELDITWPGHNESDPHYAEVTKDDLEPATENIEAPDEAETVEATEDTEGTPESDMQVAPGSWDALREEIAYQETEAEAVVESTAAGLPDTGFGIGIALAGAIGGAFGTRKLKKA